MNELFKKPLAIGIVGLVGTAITDLRKYLTYRKENPGSKFDWTEAFINWGIGFATGLMSGFGIEGAAGALGVSA